MFCAGFDSMVPISLSFAKFISSKKGPAVLHQLQAWTLGFGTAESASKTVNNTTIHRKYQLAATESEQTSPFWVRRTLALSDSLHLQYGRYTMTDVPTSNSQPVPMLDFSRQFATLRQELLDA